MSLAGFKKQLNKANQYVSERIGGAECTKLDEDFVDMEKKIDVTNELVVEIQDRVKEYLQPNPAVRAKLQAIALTSKIRGTHKTAGYPQPEGLLGECMSKYGKDLGSDSSFGQALVEAGESMKQLADYRYGLEDNVRQNFLEPLHQLQNKDLKEAMHHRKKLQGRRLDFDCKKRKQKSNSASTTDTEIKIAEDKFVESQHLAESAMSNLLDNDVEQISQLCALVEAQIEWHKQSVDTLESLLENLHLRKEDAANRPHAPKKERSNRGSHLFNSSDANSVGSNEIDGMYNLSAPTKNGYGFSNSANTSPYRSPRSGNASPNPSPRGSPRVSPRASPVAFGSAGGFAPSIKQTPCCKALYDFDPENEGELGFKEGDTITLLQKIDENWYEGTIHGETGFFPCNYVDVLVPLSD